MKQRWREEYNAKNNEEKRSAREDRRNWLEKRAAAAEKAAESGRSKELYSIIKSITGEMRKQEISVKDKQGVLRIEGREKLQRWVEHLSEILNSDDPTNPVEEDESRIGRDRGNTSRKMAITRGQECIEEDKVRESGWSR